MEIKDPQQGAAGLFFPQYHVNKRSLIVYLTYSAGGCTSLKA